MSQHRSVDVKKAHAKLLKHLDKILEVSGKKFQREAAPDVKRLAWGRLMVGAITAYGKIVETAALADFEERIRALEQQKQKG